MTAKRGVKIRVARTTRQRAASSRNAQRAHMSRVRTHEPRSPGRVRPLRRRA